MPRDKNGHKWRRCAGLVHSILGWAVWCCCWLYSAVFHAYATPCTCAVRLLWDISSECCWWKKTPLIDPQFPPFQILCQMLWDKIQESSLPYSPSFTFFRLSAVFVDFDFPEYREGTLCDWMFVLLSRITAATHIHNASSRSHAILTIHYTQVS